MKPRPPGAEGRAAPDDAELVRLFREDPEALAAAADRACRSVHGDAVHLRGLIEFTNHCSRDCAYCGIRASNRKVRRYRLSPEEILALAVEWFGRGIRSFVLQGGEDPLFADGELCRLVERIKAATGGQAAVVLSVGLRPRSVYRSFREAGADRYLMRFETSDASLYASLKGGDRLADRLEGLRQLRDLGFEVGSGFMTGLPGATEETTVTDAFLCRELELDMVGIGPFIPHPDTPLGGAEGSSIELARKAAALTRLLLPRAHMPATTAAGSLDPEGREKMIRAGANVLMPNLTPAANKRDYLLYPGKICLDEEAGACLGCLSLRMLGCGKRLDYARAGALRLRAQEASP